MPNAAKLLSWQCNSDRNEGKAWADVRVFYPVELGDAAIDCLLGLYTNGEE